MNLKVERVKNQLDKIKVIENDFNFEFNTITVMPQYPLERRKTGCENLLETLKNFGCVYSFVDNSGYLPATIVLGLKPKNAVKLDILLKVLKEINEDYKKGKHLKKFNLRSFLNIMTYEPQLNILAQMFEDEKNKGIILNKYHYQVGDNHYLIIDNENAKVCVGNDYNYIFLKKSVGDFKTGYFQRWGKTVEDDPLYSPIGPEILDIEISQNGCPTIRGKNCQFCYKGNTNKPATNMPFYVFQEIFDKMPKTLTQIAFGITGCQTNPDFLKMMWYCREHGVIPNFTLSGADLTDELAIEFSKVAGAIAVSAYSSDKEVCYNTVKKLTDLGMQQINIHAMVSQETLPFVYEVLKDRIDDPRLSKLNAIVFLGVKPKGRAKDHYHSLTKEQYGELVKTALDLNVPFGFDSCSAPKFVETIKSMNLTDIQKKQMIESSESCESSLISSYINTFGEYWHCSFTEEEPGYQFVDVVQARDFLKDVWYSNSVKKFRDESILSMNDGCRHCIVFPEINI